MRHTHTQIHTHVLRKTDATIFASPNIVYDMWVAEQYLKSCEQLDETLTIDKFCYYFVSLTLVPHEQ